MGWLLVVFFGCLWLCSICLTLVFNAVGLVGGLLRSISMLLLLFFSVAG